MKNMINVGDLNDGILSCMVFPTVIILSLNLGSPSFKDNILAFGDFKMLQFILINLVVLKL